MNARKHISLKTKLAAALCALAGQDGTRRIPHEHAKLMSAEQIISLFDFHHSPVPHAEGGPDEPWNLDPVLKPEHRIFTAKVDVPGIAKRKRVAAKHSQHQAAMAAKITGEPAPRRSGRKIRSRGFPKVHRPMRSRKFAAQKGREVNSSDRTNAYA